MLTGVYVIAGLMVVGLLFVLSLLSSMFRKVGPNQALIVYGLGGTQIVQGGGKMVWPLIQSCRELSLELMSFDVAPRQDLFTIQGVAVNIEAVTQLKVKSDPESIRTSAEQFLTKTPQERENLIRLVMEGHLRGIVGQLTVEQIVKEPENVADKMRSTCAEDMTKMGLEVISFTIKEVRDQNEYIANMGKPDVARIKRQADIAIAEAERDTTVRRAETSLEAARATAHADQERVIAEAASATRQAEATRDLDLKKAEYMTVVRAAQAQADKAYDVQVNVMQQKVVAEQVGVERIQREEQIKVQDAEVKRRERELEATILKVAEAEKQRILTLAEAERQRRILEAEGQSQAVKVEGAAGAEVARIKGQATADVTRLQGQAEADIILSKGRAEAEAMSNRAGAYREYNQAAILDRLLAGFPEIVRAVAEPLSKVDRITIVSTDGNQTGANKLTGDMVKIIAQVPALFETLAGVKLSDLLARVPALSAEFERARSEVACADDQTEPGTGAAGAPATEGKRKK